MYFLRVHAATAAPPLRFLRDRHHAASVYTIISFRARQVVKRHRCCAVGRSAPMHVSDASIFSLAVKSEGCDQDGSLPTLPDFKSEDIKNFDNCNDFPNGKFFD